MDEDIKLTSEEEDNWLAGEVWCVMVELLTKTADIEEKVGINPDSNPAFDTSNVNVNLKSARCSDITSVYSSPVSAGCWLISTLITPPVLVESCTGGDKPITHRLKSKRIYNAGY